jgi:hypothetical protein
MILAGCGEPLSLLESGIFESTIGFFTSSAEEPLGLNAHLILERVEIPGGHAMRRNP